MERRLGKIQARHPQVNDLFDVTLRDTPQGVRLEWKMKEERKAWRALPGLSTSPTPYAYPLAYHQIGPGGGGSQDGVRVALTMLPARARVSPGCNETVPFGSNGGPQRRVPCHLDYAPELRRHLRGVLTVEPTPLYRPGSPADRNPESERAATAVHAVAVSGCATPECGGADSERATANAGARLGGGARALGGGDPGPGHRGALWAGTRCMASGWGAGRATTPRTKARRAISRS